MATVQIQIKNMDQIKAAFSRFPYAMARELKTALKQATFHLGSVSSQNAPVRTGFLRRSHFLPGAIKIERLRATLEPTANYAVHVHEGTRYMQARPFLLTAVRTEEDMVQSFFTRAVERVIKEVGKDT